MSMPFPVAADYEHRIRAFPGGAAWFDSLPEVLVTCAAHWCLTLYPPFDLSYNYVCPAVRADGLEVVLKIGLPTPEFAFEQAALTLYDGTGIVRLIDTEPSLNAMLLERIRPGTMLSEITDDDKCTDIAAEVMARLWIPAPSNAAFPTTLDWAKGLNRVREKFNGGTGPLPETLVDQAVRLFSDLHASAGEQVLLHGDLHHFNILRGPHDFWLALDPKGVLGEREYEIGALLRNPDLHTLDDAALKKRTLRRIDRLAELFGFDRQRLIGYCHAQDVLSNWWGIEDDESGWDPTPRLAIVLNDLI